MQTSIDDENKFDGTGYTLNIAFDMTQKFRANNWYESMFTIIEDADGGHTRTGLTADNWGTVCLPYDLDVKRDHEYGAEFYVIADVVKNSSNEIVAIELAELEEGQTIQAGVPYFFKATGTELVLPYKDFYTTEETTAEKPANGLHGALATAVKVYDNNSKDVYMLKDNKLYKAAAGSSCAPYRAYIILDEIGVNNTVSAAAPRVRMSVGDDATGILFLESDNQQPVSAAVYDLSGRRVNPAAANKGIYIQNGKKVMK